MPPRPQPSYTIEQREDIAAALARDRESARYTNRVVRYRAGLSELPPPPAPPPSTAGTAPGPAAAPRAPEPAEAVQAPLEEPPEEYEDGDLDELLRRLGRDAGAAAGTANDGAWLDEASPLFHTAARPVGGSSR